MLATADDVMRWADVRNMDRINKAKQKLQEQEAQAEVSASPNSDENLLVISPTFGSISEFFFLSLRCLHKCNLRHVLAVAFDTFAKSRRRKN